MLHLARRRSTPAKPPFPLLHVDTTWKFREMYAFRDRMAARARARAARPRQPRGRSTQGINPFDARLGGAHRHHGRPQGLKQALDKYGFDAAFGGARRDEEKSRAKERDLLVPLARSTAGTRRTSGPSSGASTTRASTRARRSASSRSRTGPSSTSGSTSTSRRSRSCRSTSRAERPVVERDGTLIMVDDERMPLEPGEEPMLKQVRFRTLGCYPLTGAVESDGRHAARDHPGDAADARPPSARAG